MSKEELMRRAIVLSVDNVRNGGGPFGAVIAKDGEVVATGVNRVTANNDPTAHAEVQAIRAAAEKLADFNLVGCDIYASCEPCPMCLGAIYWARISHLYFAATKDDAANAGFDDAFIYSELALPYVSRHLPTATILSAESAGPFKLWKANADRVDY